MIERTRIHEGMSVRSSDGRKVGRISNCSERSFIVEKGFFFVTDYTAGYEDVADVSRDEVTLSCPRDEIAHASHASLRVGGLGESITLGIGGYVLPEQLSFSDDDTDILRRDRWHADHSMKQQRTNAPTYGDEGGGGLL